MNIWDVVILLVIAGAVVFGFYRSRKRKAAGKGCCGESCGCCTGNCARCSEGGGNRTGSANPERPV